MEFFKIRRTIPFMRHALVFNIISLITFLAAVGFLIFKGLNFSIEFTGGTLIEVGYQQAADVDAVRRNLDRAGFKTEITFCERSALLWFFSRCMRISTSREEPKFCTSAL